MCVEESINQPPPPPPPPPPQVPDSFYVQGPTQPLNQTGSVHIRAPLLQNQGNQKMWSPAPSAYIPNSTSNITGQSQSKVYGPQPQNQEAQLSYAGALQSSTAPNKVTKMSNISSTQRNQPSNLVLSQDKVVGNLPLYMHTPPPGSYTSEQSQSSQQNISPPSPSLINPNFPSEDQRITNKTGARVPLDIAENIPLTQSNVPSSIRDSARSESVERIRSRGRPRSVVRNDSRGRSSSTKARKQQENTINSDKKASAAENIVNSKTSVSGASKISDKTQKTQTQTNTGDTNRLQQSEH